MWRQTENLGSSRRVLQYMTIHLSSSMLPSEFYFLELSRITSLNIFDLQLVETADTWRTWRPEGPAMIATVFLPSAKQVNHLNSASIQLAERSVGRVGTGTWYVSRTQAWELTAMLFCLLNNSSHCEAVCTYFSFGNCSHCPSAQSDAGNSPAPPTFGLCFRPPTKPTHWADCWLAKETLSRPRPRSKLRHRPRSRNEPWRGRQAKLAEAREVPSHLFLDVRPDLWDQH